MRKECTLEWVDDNGNVIPNGKSTEQNVADVPSGDLISRAEVHHVLSLLSTEGGKDAKMLIMDAHEHIEALPSADYSKPLQTTLNGDLISRADAIEVGNKIVEELALSSVDWDALKYWAKELFDALPSADRQTDESCQDCPLYDAEAKNCPRFNKVIPQTRAEMTADRPTIKQTDTLIIADALRYLVQDTERHESDRTRAEELRKQILQYGASMCHSADRPQVNSAEWVAEKEKEFEELNRPRGEWIDREDSTDLFFLYRYECSVCGGKNVSNSSYCPNCGAHMR